jgi:tRNA (guanine37-N1)-methyltransferase
VLTVRARDLAEFTEDRHRTVDDVPYGGGPGMVLKPEPLFKAVDAIRRGCGRAAGDRAGVAARPRFSQTRRRALRGLDRVVILCGRYEGIDDRVRENLPPRSCRSATTC